MEIQKNLKALDKERQRLKNRKEILLPVIFALGAAATIGGFVFIPEAPIFMLVAWFLLFGLYSIVIGMPFKKIKDKVKSALVAEFIKTYHPDLEYDYSASSKNGRQIAKAAKLVGFNRSSEEDVIRGKLKDTKFYLSELKLRKKSGKKTRTVFKGMLFEIEVKGKHFPQSEIQSSNSIWKSLSGGLMKHEAEDFNYTTSNKADFENTLGPLFPFIKHLNQNGAELRIRTVGNKITILMESDMKFLDDPKFKTNQSFFNQEYNAKMGQQLNTLFYIVETFANNLDSSEIVERLELKMLEKLELGKEE